MADHAEAKVAVLHVATRRVRQRQRTDVAQRGFRIAGVGVGRSPRSEPRRMRQQLAQRDVLFATGGELGDESRHGIVQTPGAVLEQHQRGRSRGQPAQAEAR